MAGRQVAGRLALGAEGAPDEIVGALRRLGFTEYEGRIYVHLLRRGEAATAYEIAKGAGVPRPNAYTTLESLARRSAVLPVSESPVRYVAADPRQFLQAVARTTSALCEEVADELAELAPERDGHYVWTVAGEAAIHAKLDALIRETRRTLLIKAADDLLRRHRPALEDAAARDVEMLIVLFGSDAREFAFGPATRVLLHEGNGVRMGATDNLFTLACDHREMITAREEEGMTAVHTRNYPVVNMAASLIRHDYYMAEIFARFGRDIEDAFGQHLRDLRLACFTDDQVASFKAKTGLS